MKYRVRKASQKAEVPEGGETGPDQRLQVQTGCGQQREGSGLGGKLASEGDKTVQSTACGSSRTDRSPPGSQQPWAQLFCWGQAT